MGLRRHRRLQSQRRGQIRDFVRLLFNHPSIIVWACQNEPVWNTLTLTPILAAAVAEEDSTRVVVPAAGFDQHTYNGWYGGTIGRVRHGARGAL